MKLPHDTNEHEDKDGQKNRRALERFEFHRTGLNEKPEQLKAALVFCKVFDVAWLTNYQPLPPP
jgi:hypothetical protein